MSADYLSHYWPETYWPKRYWPVATDNSGVRRLEQSLQVEQGLFISNLVKEHSWAEHRKIITDDSEVFRIMKYIAKKVLY